MTKQSEAQRLADCLTRGDSGYSRQAAAELRRLDAELALWKERDNLRAANAQLLEALEEVVRVFDNPSSICDTVWATGDSPKTLYDYVRAAIAAAKGGA